jgi:hypothetical protein
MTFGSNDVLFDGLRDWRDRVVVTVMLMVDSGDDFFDMQEEPRSELA